MIYQFDTNIVLHYIRESETMRQVEQQYHPFDSANEIWISVVSIGELKSLAIQAKWGPQKIQQLINLLDLIAPVNIWIK